MLLTRKLEVSVKKTLKDLLLIFYSELILPRLAIIVADSKFIYIHTIAYPLSFLAFFISAHLLSFHQVQDAIGVVSLSFYIFFFLGVGDLFVGISSHVRSEFARKAGIRSLP